MSDAFVLGFAIFALIVASGNLFLTVRSYHRTTGKWLPW